MAQRPRYDDEFRASAVLTLQAAGFPNEPGAVRRVADHLKIQERTLRRWANGDSNPPPDKIVTELKRDIVELLDDIIYGVATEVKRRIDANELDEVSLPQLMTAMGIGVDKKQLLDGKPTQRIETIERWLDELPQDEYDAVVAEAQSIIEQGRRADPGA